MEEVKNQLKKSLIEFCVLVIISKGEIYSSDILEELKLSGLLVVEGTLYPLLSRLKNDGYFLHTWVESENSPPKKYYSLTKKGFAKLEAYKISWGDLSNSINLLIKNNEKNSNDKDL